MACILIFGGLLGFRFYVGYVRFPGLGGVCLVVVGWYCL